MSFNINSNRTIAAIATSVVGSTIGVVRLSGKNSLSILNSIIQKKINKPRYVYLRNIIDNNEIIDNAIVIYFKSPWSYTGEDMVEIQCHGGYVTMRRIYSLLLKMGAEPAQKGEFTKRSFLNGKIDLTQAEAVNSLINSSNTVLADNSIKMMNGIFSDRIKDLREKILEIIAFIEAYIDFPEDDVDEISPEYLNSNIQRLYNELIVIKNTYSIYKKLKEGIKVAIAGRPNAGKSSLLNACLKEEKAIVTHIPGTTRDVLEHTLYINGMNVTIYDTAGIRSTEDTVESIGIMRAEKTLMDSDIILHIIDASVEFTSEDKYIYDKIKNKRKIIILNKIDLGKCLEKSFFNKDNIVEVSLKTGEGFDNFECLLQNEINIENFVDNDFDFFIDNERYVNSIHKVVLILQKILDEINKPLEYTAEDLKDAKDELGSIIGEIYHDDILDKIFSTFCLGK
ncbi:MAG: tRNA uridine-5-carboxymethylaminomethyl(34) synthesis GTPase MnmE [Candidatus Muirbacterium halophilum]|nr:tRNA uridine-5-carboxymethylaminomethyl(34) synthesis GTPase MnmE [Candidatus Muirbacterium halophilum]MCK9475785.1 tRNA uridine-5-carboxymethylaminomethyl(34) synthesis GTPase MnmE [Candidatus Muirbacterium halophilum]